MVIFAAVFLWLILLIEVVRFLEVAVPIVIGRRNRIIPRRGGRVAERARLESVFTET